MTICVMCKYHKVFILKLSFTLVCQLDQLHKLRTNNAREIFTLFPYLEDLIWRTNLLRMGKQLFQIKY